MIHMYGVAYTMDKCKSMDDYAVGIVMKACGLKYANGAKARQSIVCMNIPMKVRNSFLSRQNKPPK
jgi:hypothetical protein